MTENNDDWQRRWTVDLVAGSATHDSGFVARFLGLPLTEAQVVAHDADAAIGKCWTKDGREWGIVTTSSMLQSAFESLKAAHGATEAPRVLSQLAREAGEVWCSHKAREH